MASRELSILVKAVGALQAAKNIGKVDTAVGRLSAKARAGVGAAASNITKLGLVAAGGVAVAVKGGIDSLAQLETATTQVSGAITQMGLQGAVTSQQVATWANEIEASVGAAFDDKDITSATANLIRFGKVTPQNIRPAMVVMTDLAAKTGDVSSASALLAKALADPAKAAGKLARVGVVLTKDQQAQLKGLLGLTKAEAQHYAALLKTDKKAAARYKTSTLANKQIAAQKYLLDQLSKTTKGAAVSSQGVYQRSLSTLKDVTEDAERALAEGFLPVIEKVRDELATELAKPETLQRIREFGQGLASGLDTLISLAKGLPWSSIGDAMKLAGQGAKAALDLFTGLPPWVQTAVLTGWGLNKLTGGMAGSIIGELGKGLIKGVLGMNAGVVNINAGVVNGAGGVPGAAGGVPGAAGGLLAPGLGVLGAGIGGILAMYALPVLLAKAGSAKPLETKLGTIAPQTVDQFSGLMPSFRQFAEDAGASTANVIAPPLRVLTDHQDALRRDTMTRLASVRERLEANRIAVQSGSASIVNAIRNQRYQFSLAITGLPTARATVRVTSGGALSRYAGKLVPLG